MNRTKEKKNEKEEDDDDDDENFSERAIDWIRLKWERKRWNIGYYNSIILRTSCTQLCATTQLSNQFYLSTKKNLFFAVVSLGKFINHDENSFSAFTQPSFFLRKTITCVGDEEILRFFFSCLPDTCFHIFLFNSRLFFSLCLYLLHFIQQFLGTIEKWNL